ncbi:uncharacterized protein H6S33_008532 [Morchella sextelata]|uniref:uncharacterized protein n=1 Tax=Morchella sextelata TaxID=1174677 RepID=UPI001D050622|nr:uncharacterized protein H6S33_008532 [Morchella sextelata]KAH0602882.1 hypothetical protein H6S33_008532 [Morchella sextelata]
MIDHTIPSPAATFRSAVAYIVRNFVPRQPSRAAGLAGHLRRADGGMLLHKRLSEATRVLTPWRQIMVMMKIMELAKRLHDHEFMVWEYKWIIDKQEGILMGIILSGLEGDAKHGPGRVVERPQVDEDAVARATVFFNNRGERIAAATEEMKEVILQSSRVAPEVSTDAALVEETYAILGGDGNKTLELVPIVVAEPHIDASEEEDNR